MEPEHWIRVKEIVHASLDMEPLERKAHILHACGGDAPLQAEVESLLTSCSEAGTFLETSILGQIPAELQESKLYSGQQIGTYRICELIAEGGMGTVYRAVRTSDFEKEVAIKLVKRGMDTDFILERFRHERQILASLDHPSIARLLDGGAAPDGCPYLVMEYIEGLPITKYVERSHLPLAGRLQLFRMVCSGVQFAHQHLVVHRDLKPSNILVTPEGQPKLLDFGIAKLLDPDTENTMMSGRMLTPDCASPEQVRGEPVTTASDVYSLGVLLYSLVTGQPPYTFTTRSTEEVRRVVCESEPKRPGTIQPLSQDVDVIVAKAMHKDPERRYASVEQFSEDVRRYLTGMPVMARKDTLAYRASKFIARHKTAVAATVLLAVSLTGGLAAIFWEAHIAAVQRTAAAQRLSDVRALASSNLFEINDAIAKLPGSAAARHLLIQRALDILDKLNSQHTGDREITRELAAGYERIAALQGVFEGPGIGDSQAALASYEKAVRIRSALGETFPRDVTELKPEVKLLGKYALSLLVAGRAGESLRIGKLMLATINQITKMEPMDPQARSDEARTHVMLASVMGGNGATASTRELTEAITHDRAAIDILEQLVKRNDDVSTRAALLNAQGFLALHLEKSRAFDESLRTFDAVLSAATKLPGLPKSVLGYLYNWRGNLFERAGDQRKALGDYETSLAFQQAVARNDTHNLDARINVYIDQGHIAMEQARLGKPTEGLAELTGLIGTVEKMLASDPSKLFYQNLLLVGYAYRAEILSSMGDQVTSRREYGKALAAAEALAQRDPLDLESRLSVAKLNAALGTVLARAGLLSDARQKFDLARKGVKELLAIRPEDPETLHISEGISSITTVLDECSEAVHCPSIKSFRLPVVLN